MIKINLLPVRQIKRRLAARNQVLAFAVSLIFIVAGMGVIAYGMTARAGKLENSINELTAKKKSYQKIIKEIEQLKKDKLNLDNKIKVIKMLQKESLLTVGMLNEIAANTPPNRMWLKTLKQSADKLSLTGVALDNATIAQYMKDMTASPLFINADLASSSMVVIAGKNLTSFSLSIQLNMPVKAQPASSGKVKKKRKKRKK